MIKSGVDAASLRRNGFVASVMPTNLPPANEFSFSVNSGAMTPGSLFMLSGVRMSVTAPTGSGDATYATGRCFDPPLSTPLHWAEITAADVSGGNPPRAVGVGVGGSTNTFTNGVYAVGAGFAGVGALQIFTKVGTTYTSRASANTPQYVAYDKLRLVCTNNGTNYVYTMFNNRTQVLTWTDTGNVITPGNYPAVILQGVYQSSAWFLPQGFMQAWRGEN